MKLKYGPYSPSRLEAAVCGYRFKKEYLERDPKARTQSLVQSRGAAVHEVLESLTNIFKKNPEHPFTPEDLRQLTTEAVTRHPNAYEQVDTILRCAEMYLKRPPATLTSDAETELRLAIKLEEGKFVECDYDDPKAFARGRADVMMISDDTTTALVYDHKTQMNIEEADTFQMGFYAWVISKIYPFLREVHLVLHFAQYGYYSKPIKYLTKWNEEDMKELSEEDRYQYRSLEKIEQEILTRVSIVENKEDWGPNPNNLCQYCSYAMECPLLLERFSAGEDGEIQPAALPTLITDESSARKVACAVHVIDNYVAHLKKQLKSYTAKNPPVLLGGFFYGHKPSFGYDWDYLNKKGRKEVLEVFKKHNIESKDWMVFSSTGSKKIFKHANKDFVRELMSVLPEKTTTKFGGYKA